MDDDTRAIRETGRALLRARAAEERARDAHVDAVVTGLRNGKPPGVVAKLSEFSDSYLRLLARRAKVPPARKGRRRAGDSSQ